MNGYKLWNASPHDKCVAQQYTDCVKQKFAVKVLYFFTQFLKWLDALTFY